MERCWRSLDPWLSHYLYWPLFFPLLHSREKKGHAQKGSQKELQLILKNGPRAGTSIILQLITPHISHFYLCSIFCKGTRRLFVQLSWIWRNRRDGGRLTQSLPRNRNSFSPDFTDVLLHEIKGVLRTKV